MALQLTMYIITQKRLEFQISRKPELSGGSVTQIPTVVCGMQLYE